MFRSLLFWIGVIVFSLLFSAWRSFASDLVYVSAAKRNELRNDFAAARAPARLDGSWICEMFGVRSGLQVSKNIHLYNFVPDGKSYRNRGSQIVKVYQLEGGKMRGLNDKILDELKQTSDGRLLSRLTLAGHDDDLAYSVCRASHG